MTHYQDDPDFIGPRLPREHPRYVAHLLSVRFIQGRPFGVITPENGPCPGPMPWPVHLRVAYRLISGVFSHHRIFLPEGCSLPSFKGPQEFVFPVRYRVSPVPAEQGFYLRTDEPITPATDLL